MGTALANIGMRRQSEIYRRGLDGRKLGIPVAPHELERAALARLSGRARAYIAGGAGFERTMAANRAAFDRIGIIPRMLCDVSQRDLSLRLFGRTLPSPLLLGPIGVLDLVHPKGDLSVCRAAAAEGVPFVCSTQACVSMERLAEATPQAARWFQLYWSKNLELTMSMVQRAERAGYEAIVVTVDTGELGWRPRDLEKGYLPFLRGRGIANYLADPVFRSLLAKSEAGDSDWPPIGRLPAYLELLRHWPEGLGGALRNWADVRRAIRRFVSVYGCPGLKWSDLQILRDKTKLPILIKGLLDPHDAHQAIGAGFDGIIVSNHGGRQVDGAIGALDALPGIVDAADGRIPVLFDSGIRTGADILKALCLGARAVLIGRPYVYGLALGGEDGVRDVIRNLTADFDLTMGLSGRRSIAELDRAMLVASPVASGPPALH